jgi:outer membrane receptor protein involved in Fe transport
MTTYEVSLGYTPKKGAGSRPRFYNKFTTKINLVSTDVPGMLEFQTGDATVYGVEFEAVGFKY